MRRTEPLAVYGGLAITAALLGIALLSPGYIRPDSVAVYSYVRSALIDGDLSFLNEWAMFGMVRDGIPLFKEIAPTGLLANHWWIGTSLAAAPPYAVSLTFLPSRAQQDGFFGLSAFVLAWCNVAAVFGSVAIGIRSTPRVSMRLRLFAAGAVFFGTPLFWYTYRAPLGTHGTGALLVALLTLILLQERSEQGKWLLAGLLLGLATCTRLQHAVLAPAVAMALVHARERRGWFEVAIGAAAGFAPQLVAWSIIYGHPLGPLVSGANLSGTTWMQSARLVPVLFSSFHGLFTWSPVAIPALAGLLLGLHTHRRAAAILLTMIVCEWLANGLLDRYFWGGMSFGARRFVDLAAPMIIGVSWFLSSVPKAARVAGVAGCTAWTVLLTLAAMTGQLPLERFVSGGDLVRAALSFRVPSGAELRSPLADPASAGNALGALFIVALFALALLALRSVSLQRKAIILLFYLAVATIALSATAARTAARGERDLATFGISPEATRVGPLLDQQKLLREELSWLRAIGRDREAKKTEDELAAIATRLRAKALD